MKKLFALALLAVAAVGSSAFADHRYYYDDCDRCPRQEYCEDECPRTEYCYDDPCDYCPSC